MNLESRKYSTALLQIAKENQMLEEIYHDFEMVVTALSQEKKMWQLMKNAQIGLEEKKEIIYRIFRKELNSYLYNFLMILLEKNKFSKLEDFFLAFKESYLKEKNILEATIFSAIKLKNKHMQMLQDQLEKRTGKKIIGTNIIDESILGGLVIYVDGKVMDGSVRNQLHQLRGTLQGTGLGEVGVSG